MLLGLWSGSRSLCVSSWGLVLGCMLRSGRRRVFVEADGCDGLAMPLIEPVPIGPIGLVQRGRPLGADSAVANVISRPGMTPAELHRSIGACLADDGGLWLVGAGRPGRSHHCSVLTERAAGHLLFVDGRERLSAATARTMSDLTLRAPVAAVVAVSRRGLRQPQIDLDRLDRVWLAPRLHRVAGLADRAVRSPFARRSLIWRSGLALATEIDEWLPPPRRVPPSPPPWAFRSGRGVVSSEVTEPSVVNA